MTFLTVTINTYAFLNFVSQLNNSFKLINFKMNQKKTKYSGNKKGTANLASNGTAGQRISPGVGEYAPYEDYGSIRSIQEIGLLMILFVSILMLGILFSIADGYVYENTNDSSTSISQSSNNDHIRFSMNGK